MSDYSCSVAVVGAGYMAREHVRAFCDVPGVRVAGIMSRTMPRASALAAEFGIPHVCGTMEALYEASRADLLVVAVPELAAKAVISAAVQFPWTILAEKPAGYCPADAKDITALVNAKGRRLFVALNRRFYGATRAALKDLADNPSPRFVEAFDQEDAVAALAAGQPSKVVANWMYANSIHVIDYLQCFCRGELEKVEIPVPWQPDSPGHVAALLRFSSGDLGYYHAVWNGPGPWACFVSTPERRWEMRPLEWARYQNPGERSLVEQDMSPWDRQFKPGMRMQAEEAVKAALGLPSLAVPLEEANKSMRLVQAIYGQRKGS